MGDVAARLAENLAAVRERISRAAQQAGRSADAVRLVAVTKYVPPSVARQLVATGCADLGESRPQELWKKAEALSGVEVRWHLVGHLQRNKIRRTLPLVHLIHSVDSVRLLDALEQESLAAGRKTRLLLEVNVSREAAKHGFAPEEIERQVERLADYPHLEIRGLMTMAARDSEPDSARPVFARLRELRDRLAPRCPAGVVLEELSMGMSGDYWVAVEDGATLVRIGSALFSGID